MAWPARERMLGAPGERLEEVALVHVQTVEELLTRAEAMAVAGAETSVTLQFTSGVAYPASSLISLTFPAGFGLTTPPALSGDVDGVVTLAGKVVTVDVLRVLRVRVLTVLEVVVAVVVVELDAPAARAHAACAAVALGGWRENHSPGTMVGPKASLLLPLSSAFVPGLVV